MIRIVTDSTSDLPEELINRFQIKVIPNILVINNKSYLDGRELSREEFYAQMESSSTLPSTATASAGIYHETYQNLMSQGASHILSIHASAELTGIYNTALIGAEGFNHKITVIDSQQLSLGLGFQVLAAAEAVEENYPLSEILNCILSIRQRLHVYAMLDTLEYAKRSGRISWAKFHLASMLQIRPIIELRSGNVYNCGEYRTRKKSLSHLKNILAKLGKLERLAILHTNAEEEALSFYQEFKIKSQHEPILCNVTTVIGTHVGPNAIGFAAVV